MPQPYIPSQKRSVREPSYDDTPIYHSSRDPYGSREIQIRKDYSDRDRDPRRHLDLGYLDSKSSVGGDPYSGSIRSNRYERGGMDGGKVGREANLDRGGGVRVIPPPRGRGGQGGIGLDGDGERRRRDLEHDLASRGGGGYDSGFGRDQFSSNARRSKSVDGRVPKSPATRSDHHGFDEYRGFERGVGDGMRGSGRSDHYEDKFGGRGFNRPERVGDASASQVGGLRSDVGSGHLPSGASRRVPLVRGRSRSLGVRGPLDNDLRSGDRRMDGMRGDERRGGNGDLGWDSDRRKFLDGGRADGLRRSASRGALDRGTENPDNMRQGLRVRVEPNRSDLHGGERHEGLRSAPIRGLEGKRGGIDPGRVSDLVQFHSGL
jgi:hypothetical protein